MNFELYILSSNKINIVINIIILIIIIIIVVVISIVVAVVVIVVFVVIIIIIIIIMIMIMIMIMIIIIDGNHCFFCRKLLLLCSIAWSALTGDTYPNLRITIPSS